MSEIISRFVATNTDIIVLNVSDGVLTVNTNKGGFQTRHQTTIKMFQRLYTEGIVSDLPMNATYIVYSGDTTKKLVNMPPVVLAYSGIAGVRTARAIPDFTFEHWPEARLPPFYDYYRDVVSTPLETRIPKLLWIGAPTHPIRSALTRHVQGHPLTEFTIMNWNAVNSGQANAPYKSIYDHAQYRYLIDLPGVGYSGRLKYLLLTGAVVFIMDRDDNEYWFSEFEPWVHYVPVSRGGRELIDVLTKIHEDPARAAALGAAGRARALEIFKKERVYADFAAILRASVGA